MRLSGRLCETRSLAPRPAGAGEQCLPGLSFAPGLGLLLALLLLLFVPVGQLLCSGCYLSKQVVEVLEDGVLLATLPAEFIEGIEATSGQSKKIL